MSDPNDNITVQILVNGVEVDSHTCRPTPTYGTPAWDSCMRDIEGKIKEATGQ